MAFHYSSFSHIFIFLFFTVVVFFLLQFLLNDRLNGLVNVCYEQYVSVCVYVWYITLCIETWIVEEYYGGLDIFRMKFLLSHLKLIIVCSVCAAVISHICTSLSRSYSFHFFFFFLFFFDFVKGIIIEIFDEMRAARLKDK